MFLKLHESTSGAEKKQTLGRKATFEMFYTMWDGHSQMSKVIPNSNGLEYRTLASGIIAGSMRTIIECPYEYVKVKL